MNAWVLVVVVFTVIGALVGASIGKEFYGDDQRAVALAVLMGGGLGVISSYGFAQWWINKCSRVGPRWADRVVPRA